MYLFLLMILDFSFNALGSESNLSYECSLTSWEAVDTKGHHGLLVFRSCYSSSNICKNATSSQTMSLQVRATLCPFTSKSYLDCLRMDMLDH